MNKQDLVKLYDYYLTQKSINDDSERHIKNIKFLELALLRECIAKILEESEA